MKRIITLTLILALIVPTVLGLSLPASAKTTHTVRNESAFKQKLEDAADGDTIKL